MIGTMSVCHYSAGDGKGAQKYVYFTPSAHVSSVRCPLGSVDKFLLWTGNPQRNTQRSGMPRTPAVEVSSMAIPLLLQFSFFIHENQRTISLFLSS